MWIDVKIPYEPEKRLANAYNRAMENTTAEWVLLLDHDVSLVNPLWYDMCLKGIQNVEGKNAGLITCVTSGKTRSPQQIEKENSSNIEDHIEIALKQYQSYRTIVKENNMTITGFFMLIRKSAWEQIKFRHSKNGIDKIDIDFSKRLLEAGFTIWVMPGLYVYHRRGFRNIKFK
jgi:GT2 family glycosyltransferase